MARVKHVVKKQATIKEETKKRRARFPSITQDRKKYEAAKKRTAARGTTRKNWRAMMTKEPEIVAEVEPEIQLDAIIQLVQGEVREFTTAVGFEESVETLLVKVEDRFGEKWTADGLQQDFYKITQGKNEKVRQFTGRLEAQFKMLKEKVPRCMITECLKNACFMECISNLKISFSFATRGRRLPMKNSSEKL